MPMAQHFIFNENIKSLDLNLKFKQFSFFKIKFPFESILAFLRQKSHD